MPNLNFPNDRLLVSISDGRRALGDVSRSTIYNLLAAGKLRSFKIGARRLIDVRSVRELAEGEQTEAEAGR